uniref:RNA polymerase, sigma-24 subunit, ECF subfamily n=1 Tax=Solibacter usitatus (strain Ellin6076) TaxID=234267 RepID=Q028D8_SOLUE
MNGSCRAQTYARLRNACSFGTVVRSRALNELVPLVYSELRKIASGYLRRERPDHTLRTTALVHEAYIRLANQTHLECQGRTHFYAIAAHLMRQILVDHARERNAVKRGGGNKVALEEADAALSEGRAVDLIQLDHALDKLAELDPRQSRIVEMRFFAGLTEDEIAEVLGIAPVTVKRDWRAAKLLLFKLLSPR